MAVVFFSAFVFNLMISQRAVAVFDQANPSLGPVTNLAFVLGAIDPVFFDRFSEVPLITLEEPEDGLYTNQAQVLFRGFIDRPVVLLINGEPVDLDDQLQFDTLLPLDEGSNIFDISATDQAGNVGRERVSVMVDTSIPPSPNPVLIDINPPFLGLVEIVGAPGSVEVGYIIQITNLRTGESVWAVAGEYGEFSVAVGGRAGDEFELIVTNPFGSNSEPLLVGGGVLDPPEYIPGIITPIIELEDHLYKGDRPVQTVPDPEVFEPHRFAVIRGLVTDGDGDPLSGATIRVLGHPEFGYTFSREDGEFDLAVNGGGIMVIDFEIEGRLPLQRKVRVPWQDYVYADEVALIELDSRLTIIDLADESAGMQIARGSVETDADGDRQATVLFPPGTMAEILAPSGELITLNSVGFRATEYTVGERGPRRMPGELPANVAYTYAVELSVDEALSVGASRVQFSQPLPFYVENFLNFPTGTGVPVGYYDRDRGAWVGYENGAIVEIIGVSDGLAVLDVTGDGPATSEHLTALGVTESELARLAELYPVGQSLQRVMLEHFSPWDLNFPLGSAADAAVPPEGLDSPIDESIENELSECLGCVITPETRVLSKSISMTGVPYSLRFDSDRQAGYLDSQRVVIPLTVDQVHDQVIRIEASITIAGRQFRKTIDPLPNQKWEFIWDGYDIRGRKIGEAHGRAEVRHVYPMWYWVPGGWQSDSLWGNPPEGIIVNEDNRFAFGETDTRRVHEFVVRRDSSVHSASLGGWTIDVHHMLKKELHRANRLSVARGDGSSVESSLGDGVIDTIYDFLSEGIARPNGIRAMPDGSVLIADRGAHRVFRLHADGVLERIAGTGDPADDQDGIPAKNAYLRFPTGVGSGSDGSIYIAEQDASRIRRIDPDGIIHTFAGTGQAGDSGDGGPADEAELWAPHDVMVADDGSVYFTDLGTFLIKRVDPSGIIQTFAGTGYGEFNGDEILAINANLSWPSGLAWHDGSLLVADWGNNRIRKITSSGYIYTVAGNGDVQGLVNGVPATEVGLNGPWHVAVNRTGEIVFSDSDNHAIRKVGSDGLISTVAGTGQVGAGGDGGWPFNARLAWPVGVTFAPDDTLLIADDGNMRIRAVMPWGGTNIDNLVGVASESGALLYLFDYLGRHVETRNTLTNQVHLEFSYDDTNRLASISDGDGNLTTISRTADGMAQAIVSPDGHSNELIFDGNGHLQALRHPDDAQSTMEYTAEGLLTSFTDRVGFQTAYFYDDSGEFLASIDDEGGGWMTNRTLFPSSTVTSIESAEGRVYAFSVERTSTEDRILTRTGPDGLEDNRVFSSGGDEAYQELTDGTIRYQRYAPDPRFSVNSPLPERRVTSVPSGLTREILTERYVDLADASNHLSLISLSQEVKVNERSAFAEFDASSMTWSMTSPTGRASTTMIDGQGRPLLATQAGLAPTAFQYDSRGRPVDISTLEGDLVRSITLEYHTEGHQAGYLASSTDALGLKTKFEYDLSGRVSRQIFPDGRSVQFDFDSEGNLITLTPPGRSAHVFDYTVSSSRERYEPPELDGVDSVTIYRYNLDRQLTEIERPGGEVVVFDYDFGGRLELISSDRGTVNYSYNSLTGQLAGVSAPDGIDLAYSWDGFLPVAETWSGQVSGSVTRGYDNNFWLTSEVAAGHSVAYDYDDDGLLTTAGSLSMARHPDHGFLTGTQMVDIVSSRGHNAFGELTERVVVLDDPPVPIYQASYERDLLGRIESQTQIINGGTDHWDYHYDTAGRLEMVEHNGATEYVFIYDDNDNRIQHTGPGGVVTIADYDEQDRLMAYGGIVYTHTEGGERLTRTEGADTTLYHYDHASNLREVNLPDGTQIEYLIDGRDRRVGKKINGTVEKTWIYRDQLSPIAQFDGAGNLTHRFVYAEQAHSPSWKVTFDPVTEVETVYRIVSDHLGSIRLVIEVESGVIAQQMDYGPFGEVLYDSNPGFQPFGFAGGIYDQHTGLVRFGARDYDPEVGRWTTKDSIDFGGGDANLYAYSFSDPISIIDPTGQFGLFVLNEISRDGHRIPTEDAAMINELSSSLMNSSASAHHLLFGIVPAVGVVQGGAMVCKNTSKAEFKRLCRTGFLLNSLLCPDPDDVTRRRPTIRPLNDIQTMEQMRRNSRPLPPVITQPFP